MERVVRVSSRWWGASLGPTLTTAARETACNRDQLRKLQLQGFRENRTHNLAILVSAPHQHEGHC